MKKLIVVLIGLLLVGFGLLPKTFAQDKPILSLSDAVLADLALHNYLDYISIDFKDKKSQNTITINETRQWLPASTIKLFVAMYAAEEISAKHISLDQWVTIDDKNVVPTELETSEYPVLTAGLTTTVQVLLEKMITQSDNTAYNTLLDLLDRQKVTAYVQSLGLTHTIVGSKLNLDDNQTQYEYTTPGFNINTTTAADYESAYNMIDSGKIPGSTLLFSILKKQKIQNMIPALLPVSELTIAHKTGDLDPLYHDGGIIIGDNKHYILTIFTNLGNPNVLAHISDLIFTKNYALVGQDIPDKTLPPGPQQVLDPLVMNPTAFRNVLGASVGPINVPIPQITAADLGITSKDLSLVIPDNKLPPVVISPTSPLHTLVPLWYNLQKVVVVGEKNRQQVVLSYAKQLLADAKVLQKNNDSKDAQTALSQVQTVLSSVASDTLAKPDTQTQLTIKAISDTNFSLLKNSVSSASNDTSRLAAIEQVASAVKQELQHVDPNIPQAKQITSPSSQPLIAKVTEVTGNTATVVTSSGTSITVPLTPDTKVIDKSGTSQPTPTVTPSVTTSLSPTSEETPTETPSPVPTLQKGQTIALLGVIHGNTLTPSVIATNLHQELAAPQPVTVVKVNTQNDTMVVSENGNPVQVDLSGSTLIKAKDTNVPLQSIQPGSVVVVHGTDVQEVSSDNKPSLTPAPTVTPSSNITPTTTIAPTTSSIQTTPSTSTAPTSTHPTATGQPQPTSAGKTTTAPTPGVTTKPSGSTSVSPVVTTKPATSPVPTSPSTSPTNQPPTPKVIQATSVQVVQQPTTNPSQSPSNSKPTTPQPSTSQPAQSAPKSNPPAQPPAQSAPPPPVSPSNKKQ